MTFLKSYARPLIRTARPGIDLLLLTFVVAAGSLPAFSAAGSGPAEAIALSRSAVQAFMGCTGAPGISVSVGIHGKTVWSEAFGYADLENEVPVTQRRVSARAAFPRF